MYSSTGQILSLIDNLARCPTSKMLAYIRASYRWVPPLHKGLQSLIEGFRHVGA